MTPSHKPPLRLWPGVAAVILQWTVWLLVPLVIPGTMIFAVLGGLVGGLLVLVWWVFFSRAPWLRRLGALAVMAAALAATWQVLDPSVAAGMMGMMFLLYATPVMSLALVAGAAAGGRLITIALAILIGCAGLASIRTEGVTGEGRSQIALRWTKTPEQRLLARAGSEPEAAPAAAAGTRAAWPGFRGPRRDSIVSGVRIRTDWASSPPVQLWRRAVGPGWSSFAIGGGLLYTQEQRGESEVVACYNASTGKPVWTHRDAARFWESNAGAGPRATPALGGGRVYALGATGVLNALDAASGAVIWTRNAARDTGAKVPDWGFAGSPLAFGDAVIVAASGRLAAYDPATGNPRWLAKDGGAGYSSPHLLTIGGVAQVLLANEDGVASVAPADGKVLWKHAYPHASILQPALAADGSVLIAATGPTGGGAGMRRLAVSHGPGGWSAAEVWTTNGLKPYFNDFVVHKGHAYGFDGPILSCIGLEDGKRKWKGGRYGHGQFLLLSDQDLLLVLSEEGELALVAAAPGAFKEIARFPALEGKTWNHPALAGNVLLVRNGQEMVAFRLAT
ncbi:MAG: PQQ-binding-like beta-propeller repeat protein [Bryobacteraceae bacterium]